MADCASWSYAIKLAPHPISASRSRDFVRSHLDQHGLSHMTDDVELVVSELATNAMVHAQTPFKVCLQAFEQTLLLEVEDGSQTGPFLVATEVSDTEGRGIAIVNLLSRNWGVDVRTTGGKSVWAEFSLQRDRAIRADNPGDGYAVPRITDNAMHPMTAGARSSGSFRRPPGW